MTATVGHVEVLFEAHTEKKGSWRLQEVESELIGSLYVKKPTLAELGWSPGDKLKVTLEVELTP